MSIVSSLTINDETREIADAKSREDIALLQAQINEMKGMIENARANDEYANEPVKNEKSSNVSISRTSTKKQK